MIDIVKSTLIAVRKQHGINIPDDIIEQIRLQYCLMYLQKLPCWPNYDKLLYELQCNIVTANQKNDEVALEKAIFAEASFMGRMEVCQWQAKVTLQYSGDSYLYAMMLDHFPIVQFLIEKRKLLPDIDMIILKGFKHAVFYLQYLYKHHRRFFYACDFAAKSYGTGRRGYLNILQWLRTIGKLILPTYFIDEITGFTASLPIIEFISYHNLARCTTLAMDNAAEEGRLDVVQWLHDNRIEGCTTDAIDRAAVHGHFAVIKWLHLNRREGCTTQALTNAVVNGHLTSVQYLIENRLVTDQSHINNIRDKVRFFIERYNPRSEVFRLILDYLDELL